MKNSVYAFSCILMLTLVSGCSSPVDSGSDLIPTTNISFSLPEPAHVNLWVENVYQTTVKTLVDEHRDAGNYTVTLEMADSNGNRLPDGLYTYHLTAGDQSISRTFILRP